MSNMQSVSNSEESLPTKEPIGEHLRQTPESQSIKVKLRN